MKHLDGHARPLAVGSAVKMHRTADSGYGATGRVLALSFTSNYGTPIAEVLWEDGHRDVYTTTNLRLVAEQAGR